MNKLVSAVVAIGAVILTSCGGSDAPVVDKSIMPPADSNKMVTAPVNVLPAEAQPATPGVTQGVPDPQVVSAAKTISAAQASQAMPTAGLNPAHGQPGHRCDISVGAPLNSAPAAAKAPSVQTVSSPAVNAAPPASMPVDANAKLNPPHGQPGHDCAVAVGAPLKKS
ncbi:MAG: hypothetical protein EOO13_07000 [Chitinophagaceae bacterium]|nr:MAG: hypothetical protein EOO13_07000 [Chitinophagaceae bacterium]